MTNFESDVRAIGAAIDKKDEQIKLLRDFVEGLRHLHADNPSDFMSQLTPLEYHKHIIMEVRRDARNIILELNEY